MATREKNPDEPAPDREERYPLSARAAYHRTRSLSSRNMSQFFDYCFSRDTIGGPLPRICLQEKQQPIGPIAANFCLAKTRANFRSVRTICQK
jgi:hypothetical protein